MKIPKITINFLDKRKRDVLIEADKKGLLWLSKFIVKATKLNKKKDDCGLAISPYGPWKSSFTRYSDLGLQIHCLPCIDGLKPMKGYSEKLERKKYYDSLPTDFSSIYQRIIKLWPIEIKLTSRRHASGSIWFPSLSNCWSEAEKAIDHYFDHYGNLMVWVMFKVFNSTALKLAEKNKRVLNTRRIKKSVIEAEFFKSLQASGWEEERKRYSRK